MASEAQDPDSVFPITQWSRVSRAADARPDDLDALIRQYWEPLKIYFQASFPSLRHEADVWLQDFAEDKMIKAGWLRRADRSRGKFRHFLKTSLRNFVLDRLRSRQARNAPLSLEGLAQELPEPEGESEAFDLMWVRTVLVTALQRMETDCRDPKGDQPRRTQIWEMFKVRILEPIFEDTEPLPYEQMVERFKLRSPMEASNMLLSAKRMFRRHFQEVVGVYTSGESEARHEVKELEQFLEAIAKS